MPTSPSIVRVTSETTSIMLVWTQPTDHNVDSYLIMYSFTVDDCLEVYGENVMSVNGSSRGHTLIGLEENSHFNISITAMNAVGISQPIQITTITHIAGRFPCCVHVCEYHYLPQHLPQDLQIYKSPPLLPPESPSHGVQSHVWTGMERSLGTQ